MEHLNTAAGNLAASASEKQDEGTAAETHQVQPAVALQVAWLAIASQAPLLAVLTSNGRSREQKPETKQQLTRKIYIRKRAMEGIRGRKGRRSEEDSMS